MKTKDGDWALTDDDSCQYVKKLDENTLSLIEMCIISINPDRYEVYADTINVQEHLEGAEQRLKEIIHGYGYLDYPDVVEKYGEEAAQVVAECIFEHYGSFCTGSLYIGSEDECADYIRKYVSEH